MNKREFESVLQRMRNQETVAVSNLSIGYNQTNEHTLRVMFNGVNLDAIASTLLYNDYAVFYHNWNGNSYILRKGQQRWEYDEHRLESIFDFDVFVDPRNRQDRPWNNRGEDALQAVRQFLRDNPSPVYSPSVRVRGMMANLHTPEIFVADNNNNYHGNHYTAWRMGQFFGIIVDNNEVTKEGSLGGVYQDQTWLIQMLTAPSEETSSNFSHESVLSSEKEYTEWVPTDVYDTSTKLPGSIDVWLVDGEEPRDLFGHTIIDLIDNNCLHIAIPSQLSIDGVNYKLPRGVYFLNKRDKIDLRSYERWLLAFSPTVIVSQLVTKTSFLKKIGDVTGSSPEKKTKSLGMMQSGENGPKPSLGTGRITKM